MEEKRFPKWKPDLAGALEIPRDLAYQEPLFTMSGRGELIIENYKSLLLYRPERILVQTKSGRAEILGRNLMILYYTADEMKITGRLSALNWM